MPSQPQFTTATATLAQAPSPAARGGVVRRAGLAVVALLGAVLLTLGFAAPASAHDVLEGTTPKNGQKVGAAPDKVTLTFSNNPIAIGSEIVVKDASGANWAEGGVDILDNVVTQKLKPGAPAGTYTVQWRVVSSDSHPIENTFSYVVTTGSAATAPGASTAEPLQTKTEAPQQQADAEPFPVMIVVFGVVAVILLVIVGVLARRKLGRGSEES
ncbi:methionine-rich copper-binding protein CopC [Arthrobacter woluwensis]|uniref:copper resistance CopC family protein n=1 Tax=Arthrobacter woluwensis TaxID=156980 RepID=UPI0027842844|nr:copper resistance CopC family protein [Arthrobacter woluwensis]MDQ0707507.1 methionine-rich copper-binding protein CopC [Arthrobacter woluwensis]